MPAKYQDTVLNKLEEVARCTSLKDDLDVSVQYGYANSGALIAHRSTTLETLAILRFVFEPRGVHMCLGSVDMFGPRNDNRFWWDHGKPDADDELQRLLARWAEVIEQSGTKP